MREQRFADHGQALHGTTNPALEVLSLHLVVGSILTMTDPELNAGNSEVNKIVLVLGIEKSRQNGMGIEK